jgi:biopolymer transport protein ExbD
MSRIGSGAAFGGSAQPHIAGVDEGNVNSDINVTPMIDVMLVLLIIFMVVTPSLAGYTAVLPRALTAESEKEDRVTLGIDVNGRYYLEERPQPVPPEQLASRLMTLYAARPEDHILYLKADKTVAYSVVLTAIDAARTAGVRRIATITEATGTADEQEQ